MATLAQELEQLPQALDKIPPGTDSLLEAYLHRLAQTGGEFPVSLSLQQHLKTYLQGGFVAPEQAADILSTDPVLPLRLLSTANSALFARNNPVETLLGVVQQLGFRRVAEAVEGAGEAKNYQAVFLGRALACGVLQQVALGQEIARQLSMAINPRSPQRDRVALWSLATRLPLLFMSYIRPQLFALLSLDQSKEGRNLYERNVKKALGRSVHTLAVNLCDSLSIPISFSQLISFLELPPWNRRSGIPDEHRELLPLLQVCFIANRFADEISRFSGTLEIDELITEYSDKSGITKDVLRQSIGEAAPRFVERMKLLGVRGYRLPEYLGLYQDEIVGADGVARKELAQYAPLSERMNPFLYELRACLKTKAKAEEIGHLGQAVVCTLQALVRSLQFDRAVIYRRDAEGLWHEPLCLFGRAASLDAPFKRRRTDAPNRAHMPDVQAVEQSKAVFFGDPVFGEDWPFVAFPIVCQGRVEAVFYADRKAKSDAVPLDTQEQVAVIALAEEWQDVSPDFR